MPTAWHLAWRAIPFVLFVGLLQHQVEPDVYGQQDKKLSQDCSWAKGMVWEILWDNDENCGLFEVVVVLGYSCWLDKLI